MFLHFPVHSQPNRYLGRTARIGNEGLATSFYNERDEPMADFLVKTLLECNQPVPDFSRTVSLPI